MVILIAGASHTGKTKLAQTLLEKYHYPYLSIDHLKMGLIRSGMTSLTPLDKEEKLTNFMWPVVREIIKTSIENRQNLIVEGCYIPFNWKKDFDTTYRSEIKFLCLVMSDNYIRQHFDDIKEYADVIEKRCDDDCNIDRLISDNVHTLKMCKRYHLGYIFIDRNYDLDIQLLSKGNGTIEPLFSSLQGLIRN